MNCDEDNNYRKLLMPCRTENNLIANPLDYVMIDEDEDENAEIVESLFRLRNHEWTSFFKSGHSSSGENDSNTHKKQQKQKQPCKSTVMRLQHADMGLYGLCPETDSFTAVVCDICDAVIKPQGLRSHFINRHDFNGVDVNALANIPSKYFQPNSGNNNAIMSNSSGGNNGNSNNMAPPNFVAPNSNITLNNILSNSYKKNSKINRRNTNSNNGIQLHSADSTDDNNINNIHNHCSNSNNNTHNNSNNNSTISNNGNNNEADMRIVDAPSTSYNAVSSSSVQSTIGLSNSNKRTHNNRNKVNINRKCIPIKDREYSADLHCGVLTGDPPKPCLRSLTCKSHALSLRRLVSGRSKPFDRLLNDHRLTKNGTGIIINSNINKISSTVEMDSESSNSNSSLIINNISSSVITTTSEDNILESFIENTNLDEIPDISQPPPQYPLPVPLAQPNDNVNSLNNDIDMILDKQPKWLSEFDKLQVTSTVTNDDILLQSNCKNIDNSLNGSTVIKYDENNIIPVVSSGMLFNEFRNEQNDKIDGDDHNIEDNIVPTISDINLDFYMIDDIETINHDPNMMMAPPSTINTLMGSSSPPPLILTNHDSTLKNLHLQNNSINFDNNNDNEKVDENLEDGGNNNSIISNECNDQIKFSNLKFCDLCNGYKYHNRNSINTNLYHNKYFNCKKCKKCCNKTHLKKKILINCCHKLNRNVNILNGNCGKYFDGLLMKCKLCQHSFIIPKCPNNKNTINIYHNKLNNSHFLNIINNNFINSILNYDNNKYLIINQFINVNDKLKFMKNDYYSNKRDIKIIRLQPKQIFLKRFEIKVNFPLNDLNLFTLNIIGQLLLERQNLNSRVIDIDLIIDNKNTLYVLAGGLSLYDDEENTIPLQFINDIMLIARPLIIIINLYIKIYEISLYDDDSNTNIDIINNILNIFLNCNILTRNDIQRVSLNYLNNNSNYLHQSIIILEILKQAIDLKIENKNLNICNIELNNDLNIDLDNDINIENNLINNINIKPP